MHCKLAVVFGVSSILVACGGGSVGTSGIPADARAQYVGFLAVSRGNSEVDPLTRVDAQFVKLDESIPVSSLRADFVGHTENCELLPFSDATSRGSTRGDSYGNVTPEPVSAGDTLMIESNSAQYAILYREPDLSYALAHDVSAEIPGDLRVHIPGDEFPTLTGVAFPDTPPLVVSNPLNIQQASIEQPLQWNGTGSADSMIDIAIMVRSENALESSVVYCSAKDDGQFELPAQIQAELGGGAEIQLLLMARYSFAFSFFNTDTLMLTEVVPKAYVLGEGNYVVGSAIEDELRAFTRRGPLRY